MRGKLSAFGMIFNTLDFHPEPSGRVPNAVERAYRIRTNHIVDSFSLRIPRKIRTRLFHKLNVLACERADVKERFWELEGIACVELHTPDIRSIYRATQPQAVKRMKKLLRRGLEVAAKHDAQFARRMKLWRQLLATADREFDYDLRIGRSHPSRKWRAEAVLRLTPRNYHYDVVVTESKTGRTVHRQRVKTTECALPFYEGVGFAKLLWDGQDIVGVTTRGDEVFRFKSNVPGAKTTSTRARR